MRLCIFGASGKTGSLIVEQALEKGHQIDALIRKPPEHSPMQRIIRGDILEPNKAEDAVSQADAVIWAIGASSKTHPNVCSLGTKILLAAMEKHSKKRLIAITGAVAGPKSHLGYSYQVTMGIAGKKARARIKDKQLQESLIAATDLDWTLLRPPRLTDGKLTHNYIYEEVASVQSFTSLSRADLAHFVVNHLDDKETYQKRLYIMK